MVVYIANYIMIVAASYSLYYVVWLNSAMYTTKTLLFPRHG